MILTETQLEGCLNCFDLQSYEGPDPFAAIRESHKALQERVQELEGVKKVNEKIQNLKENT